MRYQDLKKFKLPSNFRGRSAWYVQTWWLVQSFFFKPSPQFMYGWRRFLLRCFGAKIGSGVLIRPTAHIQFPWKLEVEDNCWIGDEVVLYNLDRIKIGSNSVISQRSYLCTGSHHHYKTDFSIYMQPIHIERECWLAADVFVAPGITIGAGTVVGSRSSVFKSLPEGKICYGTPAFVVKDRIIENENGKHVVLKPSAYESHPIEMWTEYGTVKSMFTDFP